MIDESTGKITGYTTKIGGADTVFPFKQLSGTKTFSFNFSCFTGDYNSSSASISNTGNIKIDFDNGVVSIFIPETKAEVVGSYMFYGGIRTCSSSWNI